MTHGRKPPKPKSPRTHYTHWDELLASPSAPMPAARQRHQLTRMTAGLDEIARSDRPGTDAWRVLSDAINLVETLVLHGPWPDCAGDLADVHDTTGLLPQAIDAMGKAGERWLHGQPMRLDGPGLVAVREVLAAYTDLLGTLPERTIIKCHRATERRLIAIMNRIERMPDGVHVVAV